MKGNDWNKHFEAQDTDGILALKALHSVVSSIPAFF